MGGKVWSDVEEEIFWTVVARMAPPGFHKESKAKKKSHHQLTKSWAPLVSVMKMHMMRKHPMWTQDDLPRRYSAISIYEHWFQNLVQGKYSPNAARHVKAHQEWLKNMAEEPETAPEPVVSRGMKKKQKRKAQQTQQSQAMQQSIQEPVLQPAQQTIQQPFQQPVQQPVQHQQHQMQQTSASRMKQEYLDKFEQYVYYRQWYLNQRRGPLSHQFQGPPLSFEEFQVFTNQPQCPQPNQQWTVYPIIPVIH